MNLLPSLNVPIYFSTSGTEISEVALLIDIYGLAIIFLITFYVLECTWERDL